MCVTSFRGNVDLSRWTEGQTDLEDGDGTDGDQDDHSHVHLGGQTAAVVGIVVLVIFLRMVQHVVVVPSTVLILRTQSHNDAADMATFKNTTYGMSTFDFKGDTKLFGIAEELGSN